MIVYLDTSASVKLYVDEPGRPEVMSEVGNAEAVATVRVAYAEARAAFARKRREGGLDRKGLRRVVEHLDGEWAAYSVVEVDETWSGGLALWQSVTGCAGTMPCISPLRSRSSARAARSSSRASTPASVAPPGGRSSGAGHGSLRTETPDLPVRAASSESREAHAR